jgi:hypothetical protein
MAETIVGFSGLSYVGRRVTRDPFRGVVAEYIYEGPQEACESAYNTNLATGQYLELDETLGSPLARLIVRTPDYNDSGDTVISTSWELVNSPTSRSIFEHPKCASITDSEMSRIKKALKNDSAEPTGLSTNGTTLFQLMRRGTESYYVSQCTFKTTQVISRNGSITVSFANQHRVYSNDALIAETGPTALYQAAIRAAYSSYAFSVPSGYVLGWLKQPPSFTNVAGGRLAVTLEYYLEAWNSFIYSD